MSPTLVRASEELTAGWFRALPDAELDPDVGVDLWFACDDGGDRWTHVCRVREGRVVDWRPEPTDRRCIVHTPELMDRAVAGGAGALDPEWRFSTRLDAPERPLPPHDLAAIEVDVSALRLPPDLDLTWTTVCLAGAEDPAYRSVLEEGTLRHELLASGQRHAGTVLTMPLADHLRLRAGGDVMSAFDHGGVLGDLDELVFLAGFLDSEPVRAAIALTDAAVWRVHDHVRVFGSLCARAGS